MECVESSLRGVANAEAIHESKKWIATIRLSPNLAKQGEAEVSLVMTSGDDSMNRQSDNKKRQ